MEKKNLKKMTKVFLAFLGIITMIILVTAYTSPPKKVETPKLKIINNINEPIRRYWREGK